MRKIKGDPLVLGVDIASIPFWLSIYVAFIPIATYMGIAMSINLLKPLVVLVEVIAFATSLWVLKQRRHYIKWNVVFPILLIISIFPIINITIDAIDGFELKKITDGFVIHGYYYLLPVIGLAMAVISIKKKFRGEYYILKYGIYIAPACIFLAHYSITKELSAGGVGSGYIVIANALIPISLLAFLVSRKKLLISGWLSIIIILYYSSLIGSRSYMLVGALLSVGASISVFRKSKELAYFLLLISLVAYISGAFTFVNQETVLGNITVAEKFQFDSLIQTFNKFFQTGDFLHLFNWEGNSRARILGDAFRGFDLADWMLGKGIYSTYVSFVERTTIEMGWAQDVYRWGLPYVIFTILVFIRGQYVLRTNRYFRSRWLYHALGILIVIRLFDGFIYGFPKVSVYSLLVFWGVMMQAVKVDRYEEAVK